MPWLDYHYIGVVMPTGFDVLVAGRVIPCVACQLPHGYWVKPDGRVYWYCQDEREELPDDYSTSAPYVNCPALSVAQVPTLEFEDGEP